MKSTRHTVGFSAALAVVLASGGCTSNPFAPDPFDKDTIISPEQVRSINALMIERYARQEPAADPGAALAEARERFAAMETMDLSIDDARVAALENNLGLSATLLSPTIAAQRVSGEEAKFEAAFTLAASWNETDDAVASSLDSSQSRFQNVTPGVTIPLYTGGQISVTAPFSRFETDNSFSTLNPAYTSDVNISLSQNLLRGAGRRVATHSIRIAEYDRQISESQSKLEVIRVLADVDRAYWRLYASVQALAVVEQQYRVAVDQLESAQRKERGGAGTEVDIVRAQSGVADRVEQIISAQNAVELNERALKGMMNIPGLDVDSTTRLVVGSVPDPVEYAFDEAELVAAAIDNRMELMELELQLAQDAATIAFAENDKLPLLAMQYTYRINGLGSSLDNSIDTLGRNNFEDWSIGVNAEIPLGNEQRKSTLAQSILARLQRLSTRDARRQAIRQEVYDATTNLSSTWNRILASRESVVLSARVLEAERRQFDAGLRTSRDVLDADTRLAEAQLAEIRALVDYQIAQIDLAVSTGTLLGQAKVDWSPREPADLSPAMEGVPRYRPASGIFVD
ncbi:MAG: TolC family protein [Phycisphaerales bacterium]|nr:TolC family protein [Phycisphaerales bacterium]